MLQRVWLVLLFFWLYPASARAVDPDRRISQYAHATWRTQDGLIKGSPWTIVQTQNGYLWLGTSSGLLRFDGVRFVPFSPEHGERLPGGAVWRLLAARDGTLWIATGGGGLSHLKNHTLTNYPAGPNLSIYSILEDRQGTIWFGRPSRPEAGTLCQVVGSSTRCLGPADGVPPFRVFALTEDTQGNLWIGGLRTLLRWTRTSQTVYEASGLKNELSAGIVGLASTSDGTIWVGFDRSAPGRGLERIVNGRWTPFKIPELDGSTLQVTALYVDREDALWIATADRGIYRVYHNAVDHFDRTTGLSGDLVTALTEDREGNLWVVTSQGVDRFSDTAFVSVSVAEGACSPAVVSVLTARDGSLWIAGAGGALSHLRNGTVSCLRPGKGLPGEALPLLEDQAGRLWVRVKDALWVYEHGTFRRIVKPDGSQIGYVSGIAEDAPQNVWITALKGVADPRRFVPPRLSRSLMRIEGLTVREEVRDAQFGKVAADPTGGIWLGAVTGGVLTHYQDGKLATYRFPQAESANIEQLLPGADGSVLAATTKGLLGWHHGDLRTLNAQNGLPCDRVLRMVFDDQGNLWLFLDCALGKLTPSELQKWRSHPDVKVSLQTFDGLDGGSTHTIPFLGDGRFQDGRLWFSAFEQLQMFDVAHARRNAVPPPVHIEQVIADHTTYPSNGLLRLPPLTRDLEIDYAALSFVAPQKVQLRYRLEGRDDAWQDPGARRQAFYSDLRPGPYRFRVIASNNDGLWNEAGATLDIVIAPAWYQTRAFLVLSVVTGVIVVWGLYQLRMRQLARTLTARFDERLAERTRVARDLHDTLLQTVRGTQIVADDALKRPDDATGMRRAMEHVSTWMGQASQEGRATLNLLRATTTEQNDLADAFRRAIEDCQRQGSIQASLSVTGGAREMHPVVRDEIYRIGYEAIRNACMHSGGSRLEVEVSYARDLTVRIADNGVGIAPAVADAGKDGHFGLQGMRERAARIGATLTVVSAPGSGTDIVVVVPGRAIFRRPTTTLFNRLRANFTD